MLFDAAITAKLKRYDNDVPLSSTGRRLQGFALWAGQLFVNKLDAALCCCFGLLSFLLSVNQFACMCVKGDLNFFFSFGLRHFARFELRLAVFANAESWKWGLYDSQLAVLMRETRSKRVNCVHTCFLI
jgi:hypothetical protein